LAPAPEPVDADSPDAASSPTPEVPEGDELDASLSSSRLFDAACAAEGPLAACWGETKRA